jgi:hypothetical protein
MTGFLQVFTTCILSKAGSGKLPGGFFIFYPFPHQVDSVLPPGSQRL